MELNMPPFIRACWPTITFSTADIVENSRMFWKVRATPRDVILSGRVPVISRPSNRICPVLGLYRPVSMLKNVVLPAPLGPMMETIERGAIWKSTLSTATRPPKIFDTPSAESLDVAELSTVDCRLPVPPSGVSTLPSLTPATPRSPRWRPRPR
jgi:hypothetical protein